MHPFPGPFLPRGPLFFPFTDHLDSPWALALTGLLVLAGFFALAWLIYRKTEHATGFGPRSGAVPPIPPAPEYDSSLSPQERVKELHSIEALMERPAYGEEDSETPSEH